MTKITTNTLTTNSTVETSIPEVKLPEIVPAWTSTVTTTTTKGCGKCEACECDNIEEEAKKLGVPVIPKLPEKIDYSPCDPNPVIAICGECGLHLHQVMGYCCPHARCPTGLGGATC